MILPVLDSGRGGDLELIGRMRMIGPGTIEVLDLLGAEGVGR